MNYQSSLKLSAPATERNREPILSVLQRVLPQTGTVLEVASGTGEHGVFFAPRLQPRFWQPSEPEARSRGSIDAWRSELGADNLLPPLNIDVRSPTWAVETESATPQNLPDITAIAAINLLHISPWESTLGLMAGANRILNPGGILYLYGAFKKQGQHTAPSNQAFDQMLQWQNPTWGVRDLEEVVDVARKNHLTLLETLDMPANNLSVVFQRQ